MQETTPEQLQELRYRFYEKQIKAGHRIRIDQVYICRHCGKAYKINPAQGASKTHCEEQDCKDEARRAAVMRDNAQRQQFYRRNPLKREQQVARRQYKQAAQVLGFQYV